MGDFAKTILTRQYNQVNIKSSGERPHRKENVNMNTEIKSKQGRKAGSVSFGTVSIEQLAGLPANTQLPISIRWARLMNLDVKPIVATTKTLKTLSEPASVTITQPEPATVMES
jgi:hypothetical protein